MKRKPTYNLVQLTSAFVMILALLWLTISIPFVYSTQQELAKLDKSFDSSVPVTPTEEEPTNPFGNNTEEKKPSGNNSFSEEYLHDHHADEYNFTKAIRFLHSNNVGTYIAYHGELLVPPPNAA